MEECRQNFERYPQPLKVIEGPLMKVRWDISTLFMTSDVRVVISDFYDSQDFV